jgi:hypothetical protein
VWPPGWVATADRFKTGHRVTTGFGVALRGWESANPNRNPSASGCESFQEAIELGLSRGHNAMAIWQDLVCGRRKANLIERRS